LGFDADLFGRKLPILRCIRPARRWSALRGARLGGQPSFDQDQAYGELGQQAPLTAEYQKILQDKHRGPGQRRPGHISSIHALCHPGPGMRS